MHVPTGSKWGFQFLSILANTCSRLCVYCSCPGKRDVGSRSVLRFVCLFVCYPLWRNVCSDPLPIFYLAICLFMVELKSSLCILDTSCPYRSTVCKYLLSFFGLAFHSLSLHSLVNYIHSLCHDFQDARVSAPLLSGDNLIPCQAGLLSLGCHSRPTPGLFPFHNVPCSSSGFPNCTQSAKTTCGCFRSHRFLRAPYSDHTRFP